MKKGKSTLKDKIATRQKPLKSKIKTKKQRSGIKEKLEGIRPLSDKEKLKINKELRKIEKSTLYGNGLNRKKGGFAEAKMDDFDDAVIYVTSSSGIKNADNESDNYESLQKIELDRRNLESIATRGGEMKEGGYTSSEGPYQINVYGDKPNDYKIICRIIRKGGEDVQVCYHETNDKKVKGVEIYSGKNYIVGSNKPSYSRKFDLEELPLKYKDVVEELKKAHKEKLCLGGGLGMPILAFKSGGAIQTIADLKRKNEELGHFFFSPATMKAFKSKIESDILFDRYFITSESNFNNTKREFKIREFRPNGSIINNPFDKKFDNKSDAKAFLKSQISENKDKSESSGVDFWISMFKHRPESWRQQTLKRLQEGVSSFETEEENAAKIEALEYIKDNPEEFEEEYNHGGSISRKKARKILHDKEVHGEPLTEKQRKYFGARASGYPDLSKNWRGGKMEHGGEANKEGYIKSILSNKQLIRELELEGLSAEEREDVLRKNYTESDLRIFLDDISPMKSGGYLGKEYREVQGTYGSEKIPTTVFVHENRDGSKWYVAEGAVGINKTYDDIQDGVDIEELSDIDVFTMSKPINSLNDLHSALKDKSYEEGGSLSNGGSTDKKPLKKGDTIQIIGKRWFQKGPGNTYHSVDVYVNNELVGRKDFTYGYGDHYLQTARALLQEKYELPEGFHERDAIWRLEDHGIKVLYDVSDVSRKKDLEEGGEAYRQGGATKKRESDPSLRPPKKWYQEMEKEIKQGNPSYSEEQVDATIGDIWYHNLSDAKREEIREREGKHYGPAPERD